MKDNSWRKSSYRGENGGHRVECATGVFPNDVPVRDTIGRSGAILPCPALPCPALTWAVLSATLR